MKNTKEEWEKYFRYFCDRGEPIPWNAVEDNNLRRWYDFKQANDDPEMCIPSPKGGSPEQGND